MAAWDRQDLQRRVRLALGLSAQALDQLDLAPGGDLCRGAAPPLIPAKLVAESTMLLRAAATLARCDGGIAEACLSLALRLAPRARGDQLLAALCRDPGSALDHAAAHIHLNALGHVDAATELLLSEVLADAEQAAPERLPNHELEHHWLRQIAAGTVHQLACDAQLLARTCLSRPLDALGSSPQELYAFTHVLLHASDMGARTAPWPRPPEAIEADAEAALAAALDAGNFDLTAELLWTWPMLGLPWSAAAGFAFTVLAHEQDEQGFLPGPGYRAEQALALAAPERQAYGLQTSYHTGFVMGFLCAAALRAGCAPPAGCSELAAAPGAAPVQDLLDLLAERKTALGWRRSFAALVPARQGELAGLLLSVALRRAAAAQDLSALRQALAIAVQQDLTQGPSVRQALALLRRSLLLSRIAAGSVEQVQHKPATTPSAMAC